MQFKKSFLLPIMAFILSACATTEYTSQKSVFIVFKTPTFKVADLGFMYENEKEVKVEMYSNGQAIMALKLGEENICMSTFECMDKNRFNKSVLITRYPKDILTHIFRAKPLFGGKNMHKTRNGFTQQIMKKDQYDINYSVLNKDVTFRDTINNIVIKIKRLK